MSGEKMTVMQRMMMVVANRLPNCQKTAELVSESMDRSLPVGTRIKVWMHLKMCSLCQRYADQLRFIHIAVHDHGDRLLEPSEGTPAMSNDCKNRIKRALRESS